jgi:hypothetical protein
VPLDITGQLSDSADRFEKKRREEKSDGKTKAWQ